MSSTRSRNCKKMNDLLLFLKRRNRRQTRNRRQKQMRKRRNRRQTKGNSRKKEKA